MHASQLVELSVSLILPHLGIAWPIDAAGAREVMTRYWVASRSRVDRWRRQLDRGHKTASAGKACWPTAAMVAEEFFLADVLARVWAGWLHHSGCPSEMGPWANVAAAVVRDHDEVRTRILRMLMTPGAFGSQHQTARLNHLRWRAHRWADLLVRSLQEDLGGESAATDQQGPGGSQPGDARSTEAAARWVGEALQKQFPRAWNCRAANPDLNRAVAIAVVRGGARPGSLPIGRAGSDLWVVGITTTIDMLLEAVDPRGDGHVRPA